jgi:hypothetical protein
MVASLHLLQWPLGTAQAELWRARRQRDAFGATSFRSVLLPIALRYTPPEPRFRAFGYLAVWPSAQSLERFRASALARRWEGAPDRLALTLEPIQSFGTWRGADPLAGARAAPPPGPALVVTHSRTRPARFRPFLRASAGVAQTLGAHEGHIWADGFVDRVSTFDMGTLSLWRDVSDATAFAYSPGVHQDAIRDTHRGGWFAESWFGRFAVAEAEGNWPGLDLAALRQTASLA